MEKYLNSPIKEIITKFPHVGKILEEYNIGCVPCTLGSCLLKDVVEIHNLAEEQKIELMYRIEKEIYPWIDRGLSTKQVGELFEKFNEAEEKMAKGVVERCKRFIETVEERADRLTMRV
jgi:hypothetical protein